MITRPTRTHFAQRHPKAYLGLHAVIGFSLSIACAWIFFAIAEDLPEDGAMVRVDLFITNWLHAHGTEGGHSIFVGVSYLGAQVLIALFAALAIVLVARRDWNRLALLGVTSLGGALLDVALKMQFHRSRPTYASGFRATSWSFPSGHAMNSAVGYGLIAYWLARRYPAARRGILLGAIIVVGTIGYARIYLGVHYLSDVLAGYSAGLTWLMICLTGSRFAERRHSMVAEPESAAILSAS